MLTNIFTKRGFRKRESPERRALGQLREFNVGSANATLIEDHTGSPVDVDLGTVLFFKVGRNLLVEDRAIYITSPDGIAAEDEYQLEGSGETVRLWFLFECIPRIVDFEILERIHLKAPDFPGLDPAGGAGFKVRPITEVSKQDQRNTLRFSHQPGGGSLPVYPQILFDVFVTLTNLGFPSEGALTPRIEDLRVKPYRSREPLPSLDSFSGEALVSRFKDAMKGNLPEDRTVHVSKPHFDEKLNKSTLLELGYSDVL